MAASDSIGVSVIVPALNEEEMIGRCLQSLAQSECSAGCFEVIVVDNGSTDRTMEIARGYSDKLQVTVLHRPGINISALRNQGAAVAKGEILAFLDADCLVPRNWIQDARRHLAAENAGIIGGNIAIPGDSRWVARAWYGVGYAPKDGPVTYVPSGNMLVRRSSFRQLGGFDDSLKTSEDCELCFRARKAGLPVCAVGTMAVVHLRTPQTLAEFYRRERWHGTHVARVFFANIRAMANVRAVALATYMLVCGGGVCAGLVLALLFRDFRLLGISAAAIVACSTACSIRKLKAVRGKQFWLHLLPLAILHAAWGLARAHALISLRSHYPRKVSLKPGARAANPPSGDPAPEEAAGAPGAEQNKLV